MCSRFARNAKYLKCNRDSLIDFPFTSYRVLTGLAKVLLVDYAIVRPHQQMLNTQLSLDTREREPNI